MGGLSDLDRDISNSYLAAVEDPLVLASADDGYWADEADMVVVGFGGAGAAAAIEARALGADVIAVDRFAGGGATAFSGGVFYAGGTRFQKEAGCADSADNMFNYLSQEESAVSPQTLRRFCLGSSGDLDWLVDHGVPFAASVFKDKTAYPPEGFFLYYSGNEKVPSYMDKATPAPRGHRTVGEGYTGYAYFGALKAAALANGVRVMCHAPVRRLVVDRRGAVLGVAALAIPEEYWRAHDAIYQKLNPMRPFSNARHERAVAEAAKFESRFLETKLIRARRGVVLSAGGFVYNLRMLQRHRPLYGKVFKSLVRIGSLGCDGSGIELGRSAGATAILMDRFCTARSLAPPAAFLHGILVDGRGRRFINEDAYTGFVGDAIASLQDEGRAWLILDRSSYKQALRQCLFPGKGLYIYTLPSLLNICLGGTRKAGSLNALAQKCGLDPVVLSQAVASNNAAASGQSRDPLGKAVENTRAIETAPFYAINMGLGNKFAATLVFTLGGLAVDEDSGAVLGGGNAPIPGLYAAGRTAAGLCSKGYLSGMSLADTVFSGRRAARSIMSASAGDGANAAGGG